MNIKELILKEFINLFENKDHLIKKLDMNDEQKQEVMDYFKKFPHREKEIDWNRKDLTYDDFVSLMKKVSKTQKKKEINKSGLEAFEEGVDVITFPSLREYIVVAPLNHDVSKLLGSDKFSGRTGEWCISANKIYYWDKYI